MDTQSRDKRGDAREGSRDRQVHGRPLRAAFSRHLQGQTRRKIVLSNANAIGHSSRARTVRDRTPIERDPVPSFSLYNRNNSGAIQVVLGSIA